jgi:hypothetical protein
MASCLSRDRQSGNDFSSNCHPALSFCLSVIFSENRHSTFPDHALDLIGFQQRPQRLRDRLRPPLADEGDAHLRLHQHDLLKNRSTRLRARGKGKD